MKKIERTRNIEHIHTQTQLLLLLLMQHLCIKLKPFWTECDSVRADGAKIL